MRTRITPNTDTFYAAIFAEQMLINFLANTDFIHVILFTQYLVQRSL